MVIRMNNFKVAAHSWGWIEENNFQAIENYFYPTKQTVDNIAKDRPHWSEMTKEQYYASVGPNGAMFVGDPAHVAQKIIRIIEGFTARSLHLHLPIGSMPHEDVLKAIKLYGEKWRRLFVVILKIKDNWLKVDLKFSLLLSSSLFYDRMEDN